MRRSRIVAFVVGMAYGLAASPAVCPTLVALGSQEPGVRQLDISGTVVRERSGSRVPGVRLQLRSLDTGLVVAQTVSDSNGAYSFAVPQPGRYGVEVVNDEGVIASSRAVTITDSPMTATVYLQDRRNTRALAGGVLAVLAAATAAGIASMVAGPAPVSPER